uniref:Putative ubiquitin-conjugating enzyme/RWD-like protein n=1 Tax=Helianthus annuus TaxID=4232 RepID=A0A251T1Z3_HELAN
MSLRAGSFQKYIFLSYIQQNYKHFIEVCWGYKSIKRAYSKTPLSLASSPIGLHSHQWHLHLKQVSFFRNNSKISVKTLLMASLLVLLMKATCLNGVSLLLDRLIHYSIDGGFFNAIMTFPPNYPNSPPTVRFTSEVWHPNVYPDGKVCISILHPPGDDPNGYELASERWTPVHTVESIVLSIISMLSSPNDESPANVEAAKEWRDRREEFKKKVGRCVRKSQEVM